MYWKYFWMRPVSEDSAQWWQFWDYIWWLLNPIIGLANLIVIIYFWYYGFIKDKEIQRKQVMPLPSIEFEQTYDTNWGLESMSIKLKNCGFWPMIISRVEILWPNKHKYGSYAEILQKFPQPIRAWTYHNGPEWVIDKWELRTLMEIKPSHGEYLMREWFDYIKQFALRITYADLFGEYRIIERSSDDLFEGAEWYWKVPNP